jgi:hypothetical protein
MMPPFDPSKMDPKALMELSQLIQQLPPDKLNRMQSLMHNMMAGFDVQKELEEFERTLPPGFREKLFAIISSNPGAFAQGAGAFGQSASQAAPKPDIDVTPAPQSTHEPSGEMDLHQARLTILRAVAEQELSPEEAERLLFPET